MSASPELRRSPVTLDQLFPRPRPPPPSASPTPNSNSPIRRQLHLHLLPLHTDTTPTTLAAELPSPGPSAPPDQQHQPPATEDDEFRTPTDEPHRIPTAAGASCGCPPAPRKPRPSAPSAPACRRRLIQGELLRIAPEEVERLFGRTWTRNNAMTTTTTPDAGVVTRTPAPEAGAGPDLGTGPGPAVLPAKKRKRCYAQVAGEKEC